MSSNHVGTGVEVTVLGGGAPVSDSAGAADGGLRVRLVERDPIGGEWSHWAGHLVGSSPPGKAPRTHP